MTPMPRHKPSSLHPKTQPSLGIESAQNVRVTETRSQDCLCAVSRRYDNSRAASHSAGLTSELISQAGPDKATNLAAAAKAVTAAASEGAEIIILPECFNSPYGVAFFSQYSEPIPAPGTEISSIDPSISPTAAALSALARDCNVYLVGGSIPELHPATKKIYNTCMVFSKTGELLATHRKIHLFDISIPGGITFTESLTLSPGNDITIVDLPGLGKIGIAICYDIRFPELSMICARRSCFAIICPAAFNTTTGPLHWTLQARARAVDNQVYVAMCSPARSKDLRAYQAWGHSMVVEPMGRVLVEAGEGEEIVYAVVKREEIEEARRGIPVGMQRRFDVYPDVAAVGTP